MQLPRNNILLAIFALAPVISSCIKTIDYDAVYERKVVVNCILSPGEEQTLQLSFNGITGSYRFDVPEEADARLFCDGTEVGRFERDEESGKWGLQHRPVPGGNYRLMVSIPGWDDITAETRFPISAPPVKRAKRDRDSSAPRSYIQTEEFPPYWIFIISQPVEEWDILMRYPAATEDDYLRWAIGSDHPGVDDFNSLQSPVGWGTDNEGKTISHYLYLRICPSDALYPLNFSLEPALTGGGLVYFRSVSDEYDKYIKTSLQKVLALSSEDDPTYWFDEEKVYGNINGGLGIFGAYDDYVVQTNWKADYYSDYYFDRGLPYDEWPFDM